MFVLANAVGVAGITAAATLLAASGIALVTILTNDRRLSAENMRQVHELGEEAKRQDARLAHARELADLDDLRNLLDESAVVLDAARVKKVPLKVTLETLTATTVDRTKKASAVEEGFDLARAPMAPLLARLRVRLGSKDQITKAFDDSSRFLLLMAMDALRISAVVGKEHIKIHRAAFKGHSREFDQAAEAFFEAAVARAGTVPLRE